VLVSVVIPSPPANCSFNTTRTPAVSRRTVFGAGFTGMTSPPGTSVPPSTPFTITVVGDETSAPHGPSISAEDETDVASSVRSGPMSMSTESTVAWASTCSLPGTVEDAFTVRTPVLKT
jgi:hypothetical protein